MGRELKRVPLDFDWPLKKKWEGYLNPWYQYSSDCPDCSEPSGGLGYNKETARIARNFYNYSSETGRGWYNQITQEEVDYLQKKGRLRTFVRDPVTKKGEWKSLPLTAEEVNASQDTRGGRWMHDGANRMYLIEFRAKKHGVWGVCETCEGDGIVWSDGILEDGKTAEELAEVWEPFDPPKGEGYQLWETTSEGSPMTPVFATADELAGWCASTNVSVNGSFTAAKEQWLKMFEEDFIRHEIDTEGGGKFVFM